MENFKEENLKKINENNLSNSNYNKLNDITISEKLLIGKKFGLTTEIISTLTTASLRADLVTLQVFILF